MVWLVFIILIQYKDEIKIYYHKGHKGYTRFIKRISFLISRFSIVVCFVVSLCALWLIFYHKGHKGYTRFTKRISFLISRFSIVVCFVVSLCALWLIFYHKGH